MVRDSHGPEPPFNGVRACFPQRNGGASLELGSAELGGAVGSLNQPVASLHLQKQSNRQVEQLATGPQVVLESLIERDVVGGAEPMQLLQLLSEAVHRLRCRGQSCCCLCQ